MTESELKQQKEKQSGGQISKHCKDETDGTRCPGGQGEGQEDLWGFKLYCRWAGLFRPGFGT